MAHVLQRGLGHTLQGSKSTQPLTASLAALSHGWDGARTWLVIEAHAHQQPKPRNSLMSVSRTWLNREAMQTVRPFLSLQIPWSLLCSVPTGAGPGCAMWGPCPEPPIYVHPSPAPTCPPLWPGPPARAICCSPARRERRALVPGTAGWQVWGCANPAACLTWRTHSEA